MRLLPLLAKDAFLNDVFRVAERDVYTNLPIGIYHLERIYDEDDRHSAVDT